ncbi:phytanoyl-CoA dioxygenase family protein [Cohnella rhizosphaerae]|uniref:Phytanoyl-CoA dioxygenase family protein n=1 Tax=Cohnella rhizosphaerae TaxID=1457232 RepID=A0A9X4QVQ1_9BACL|nr:phytanoyl-CoA dioxygenase family protein [Cohnella rhizosphaerae]MDG0812698.1 phytanoyl-CoA dioxygenase family protein [Cohnella rhizosphaerae]
MNKQQTEAIYADARSQSSITEEQARFFLDNGFLVIKGVLHGEELKIVQDEMEKQVAKGVAGVQDDPDYMYGKGGKSGRNILRRIEYIIDKSDPMKALLGHPFILRSVEKLQGRNFIPTWDSMVLKMPDEGIIVPWHRDAEVPDGCTDPRPIFNVDFYLDAADLATCLWVIPGSNKWSKEACKARIEKDGADRFSTEDAIPVPLEAGDAIFHDITVLHGSPAGDGNPLRRTVYYEFRPGEIEWNYGPHTREYLGLKQQMLLSCLDRRADASYAQGEEPFVYRPDGALVLGERKASNTFRYPHLSYWRD